MAEVENFFILTFLDTLARWEILYCIEICKLRTELAKVF
jgi:hypothetical protein